MMDSEVRETIEVPEEVDFTLDEGNLEVRGPNGELSRSFDLKEVELEESNDELIVRSESSRRKRRAEVGMIVSHIENMFEGATEGFSSKLRVVYSHFPISVNVEGNKVKIENFIGEEKPRVAEIVGDTEVEINDEEMKASGPSKEDVGQTAANIEQATKAKNRDPRTFQDGVYVVEGV